MTIADVAYLSGFSSQSHLTSATKKYKQIRPTLVRRAKR
jgi:AraC family transcriptional regulator